MSKRKLEIEDRGDHVAIRLEGDEVTRCYVDYQFSLLFGDTGALVVIESPFTLSGEGGERQFDPEDWTNLGPALELVLFKKVAAVKANKNGELEISFEHGETLRVPADPNHESWNLASSAAVTSAEGAMIVCMPGGKLAIWGSDPSKGGA